MGFGWKSRHGTGIGKDSITGGPEVTWTQTPTKWSNYFFENLFGYEWELTKSPAGAYQWQAKGGATPIPDAFDPSKRHAPTMLVTDLSLRIDPVYEKISRRFYEHPDQFADAFARAWFKLTHRDMGPRSRYLGPEVPAEELIWQDPIPAVDHKLIDAKDIADLKAKILASGHSDLGAGRDRLGLGGNASAAPISAAERTARAFVLPRRRTGKSTSRRNWRRCCRRSKRSKSSSTLRSPGGKKVSLADLIVLGGCAAVEEAAKKAGHNVTVPFTPGRTDASQEQTDVESFAYLEPVADGFRNYLKAKFSVSAEELLIDKAQLLTLTAPEMTVLVGGLRVLGANAGKSTHGVFTKRPETLTNDFFVNLLDMGTQWQPSAGSEGVYEGRDRKTNEVKWTGTRVDLIFGSNSELRALAEVYALRGLARRSS